MVSRCDVSGHCGHWHSAGRGDFDPVCCWCNETHPGPGGHVGRCSDHMRDSEADPANLHDLAWCNECFRSVYLRPRHIATYAGEPE
jgi:hypothetical protein